MDRCSGLAGGDSTERLDRYCDAIAGGYTRSIDVGRFTYASHKGHEERAFFVNILSMGLGGLVDQYVADMEAPTAEVRSRRPLKKALISVEDVEGQPGWYKCEMKVQPHFKYMGASFTLSLVGKLDKQ